MKLVEIMRQRNYFMPEDVRISFIKKDKTHKVYIRICIPNETCKKIDISSKDRAQVYLDTDNKSFLFLKKTNNKKMGFAFYEGGKNCKFLQTVICLSDYLEVKPCKSKKVKHEILEGGVKIYLTDFKEGAC